MMAQSFGLVILGLVTGVLSGLLGIGGGIIIVPALTMLFQEHQLRANVISLLAMSFPVFWPSLWKYWQEGYFVNQDWLRAGLIAIGMLGGSVLGTKLAMVLGGFWVKRAFGVLLVGLGLKLLFEV